MESFTHKLLKRELGLGSRLGQSTGAGAGFSVKEQLTKLTWTDKDRIIISDTNPIYSMEFCPISTLPKIVAVSDEIGGVSLIDTETPVSSKKVISTFQCHRSSLYSITWSTLHPNMLATGASDQLVCVWDADSFEKIQTFTGHQKTVRRVRFHHSKSNILGSSSRDGSIILWDLRQGPKGGPANQISSAHSMSIPQGSPMSGDFKTRRMKKIPTPVTDFVFIDDNTIVSCGATDGQIKFWDIRKTYKYLDKVEPFHYLDDELNNCKGYSGLVFDGSKYLYASTAISNIVRYKIFEDTKKPDAIYKRPSSDYNVSISLSPDGRYLLSGSVSPYACIWDTWDDSTTLPFVQLEGTCKEYFATPCALFSPNDPVKVVTGADDSNLTIWRFNPDPNSGSVLYKSRPFDDIPMAEFNKIEEKMPGSIPIHRKLPSILPRTELLEDLPNFVIDGRQPHVPSTNGRKPTVKVYTWLANFSKPNPLSVPVKKTIKLKRKVTPHDTRKTSKRRRRVSSNSRHT